MKKVAFVSAPWRNVSPWHVKQNRYEAEFMAEWLWREGFAVICPHKNSQDMDGLLPDECFLEGTLEIMCRCDFVVYNPELPISEGMRLEFWTAQHENIPIMQFIQEEKDGKTIVRLKQAPTL